MGCAGSGRSRIEPQHASSASSETKAPEHAQDSITVIQVPEQSRAASLEVESDDSASPVGDLFQSANSCKSGPPAPSIGQVYAGLVTTLEDLWNVGRHKMCFFGITEIVETETLLSGSVDRAKASKEGENKMLAHNGTSDTGGVSINDLKASMQVGSCCHAGLKLKPTPNQDNIMFVMIDHVTVCGVADGHGEFGHWASHWVIQFALAVCLKEISEIYSLPAQSSTTREQKNVMVIRLFNACHQALRLRAEELHFDMSASGSTLSLCFIDHKERTVMSASVGDSRSILWKRSVQVHQEGKPPEALLESNSGEEFAVSLKTTSDAKLSVPEAETKAITSTSDDDVRSNEDVRSVASEHSGAADWRSTARFVAGGEIVPLSFDHCPMNMQERQRILSCGGVVKGGGGKARVFSGMEGDTRSLAMSRAIGDFDFEDRGVSHMPDIRVESISEIDVKGGAFVLVCSDGVWEFMQGYCASEVVAPLGPARAQQAAETLVAKARDHWMWEVHGGCEDETDDISAVLVWIDGVDKCTL